MTSHLLHPTRRPRSERGVAALWVIFLASVTLAAGGLVIDGGYTMAAKREAARVAEQAARAAADELDTDSLRTGGADLDPAAATIAGRSYLSAAGESGTVHVSGRTVTVTVTKTQHARILSAFGTPSFTVRSTASATSIDEP